MLFAKARFTIRGSLSSSQVNLIWLVLILVEMPCQPVSAAELQQTRGQTQAGVSGTSRVLPVGELPADTRLASLKNERGDFRFEPPASNAGRKARAEHVRRVMLVALGLWPMPTKTPMNTVIHGKREFEDYQIEKVYFESLPGFFVTGNLYRPRSNSQSERRPAVLSPHGHFPGGRFIDEGRDVVRQKIVRGAERFEEGGRSFMQSRCVQLARMGCVVFHYDMIGYGDSVQIPLEVAHRFSRLRIKFKAPPAQGFYSALAELRLQNSMGLHTYNSIRALDFLTCLPDVDPKRVAVTGGSGGGTQTFMLCAVDRRPLVSVPVVIVSTTRQGGCTCENISGLRLGTYNLEFTALHAPKPLLLISADDATRTMNERGFPSLQQLYRNLGAEKNVAHTALLQFPHNYNSVSRAAMYHWLNQHFELELAAPILERPFKRQMANELTVWDEDHPQPAADAAFVPRLLDWLSADADKQMAVLFPQDRDSLQQYRRVVGAAWKVLIRGLPEKPNVKFEPRITSNRGSFQEIRGLLRYQSVEGHRAELPVIQLVPHETRLRTVVRIDDAGKAGLYATDGAPKDSVQTLLDAGCTVTAVDLLRQGEFLSNGRAIEQQLWLPGEIAFAGWTYCYNLPLFARRVHDILALIDFSAAAKHRVDVIGHGNVGPLVAAAVAQSRQRIRRAAISTRGFRFAELTDVYHADFLPGAVKYGDIPALLALSAPTQFWVAGENEASLSLVRSAYHASGKPENLTVVAAENANAQAAVSWLNAD